MTSNPSILLLSLIGLGAAHSAPITWGNAPYPVTGVHPTSGKLGVALSTGIFNQTGTLIRAENVGGSATTFDGIHFTAGTIGMGDSTFGGYHENNPASGSNTPLAAFGAYGASGPSNVALTDLVIGYAYRIQALVYDGRIQQSGRTVKFNGQNQGRYAWGTSTDFGPGLLMTGTFTADAVTQNFTIEAFSGASSVGGQLNALLLHYLPPAGTPSLAAKPSVSSITASQAQANTTLYNSDADVTLYWDTVNQGDGVWTHSTFLGAKTIGPISGMITGLAPDTVYFYRFKGINAIPEPDTFGWGPSGSSFATGLAGKAPASPNASTVSGSQIKVEWADNFATETGYIIERSPNASGPWTQISAVAANVRIFTDTDLHPLTSYFYRVRAVNGVGPSDSSEIVSTTTSIDTPGIQIQAWYRMGDDGQGANNIPVDSSGNGRDFTPNANSATIFPNGGGYNNDAFYSFNGTNQGYSGIGYNAPEDNVGIEVWVRSSSLSQVNRHVLGTGTNQNGLNIGYDAQVVNGSVPGWFGAIAGKAFVGTVGTSNYAAGEWIHLAVVRENGTATFYVNGVADGTSASIPNDATQPYLAINASPLNYFNGDIAEARIFTFTPGAFDPSTDFLSPPSPPQVIREEVISTIPGATYLLRCRIEPKAGDITVPRLQLTVNGNATLVDMLLTTPLPNGATGVPYFTRFVADSTSTTVRFITRAGDSATAGQAAGLEIAEPLTATPATTPNVGQQAQIDRRYGLFLHFGINTFHNEEWTDGTKPASSYQPTALDVDQWVQTAYEAGMRYVLIISKHHDGFCLWDSPWTDYDVGSTSVPTDVIAAAAAACQKYGIKLALYYSIWDRHEPTFTNDEAYNTYMLRQFEEMLGNYGPICELWLDGGWAKSNTRWPITEIYDLVRRLQPDCQVSTNWTIGAPGNPDQEPVYPNDQQEGYPLQYFSSDFRLGDPYLAKFPDPKIFSHNGQSYYLPFEATITLSSQNKWFFNTGDLTNKPVADLARFYYSATAQNNMLVLNAPPDRSGKVRSIERNTLFQLRDKLGLSAGAPLPENRTGTAIGIASAVWENDVANYGPQLALDGNPDTRWSSGPLNSTSATLEIDLGTVQKFNRILIDEYEQSAGVGRITSFRLQAWSAGQWITFHTGTTCRRYSIHNFPDQSTNKVRLLIDTATREPSIWEFQIHDTDHAFTSWRDQQFSPNGNSDPAYAWNGDPDLDGRANWNEFALNDNPNTPAPSGKSAILPVSDSALNEFVFTMPARSSAIFTGSAPPTASADGIDYQIDGSVDLGVFNAPLEEIFPAKSADLPSLDPGWSYHSFRHTTPELQSGFFRIKISPD